MQAFIVRRYRDGSKEGSKAGIVRAENVGVVLANEESGEYGAYQKAVQALHGKIESILTEKTNAYDARLYQEVIRQNSYTYFLEKADSLIV